MVKCNWQNSQQMELIKFSNNKGRKIILSKQYICKSKVTKATVTKQKVKKDRCSHVKGIQSSDCSILTSRQERIKIW